MNLDVATEDVYVYAAIRAVDAVQRHPRAGYQLFGDYRPSPTTCGGPALRAGVALTAIIVLDLPP